MGKPKKGVETETGASAGAPEQEPQWFRQVKNDLQKLSTLETSFKSIEQTLKGITDSIKSATDEAKGARKIAEAAVTRANNIQNENIMLKNAVRDLQNRIVSLEGQSRRNNLIFEGIQEGVNETWADSEKALIDVLNSKMGIENINLERVHRLGKLSTDNNTENASTETNKPRPLIAKFNSFKDKQMVLNNKTKLKSTNIWISEDYPPSVRNNRKRLFPILKAARNSDQITSVSLKQDKLYINNKQFTVENMHNLPACIHPHNVSMAKTEQVQVFYSQNSYFSNLHPMDITVEGKLYSCNEQYYQAEKARYFGDHDTMDKIMATKNPYAQLALGKAVKGYTHDEWMGHAHDALKRANEAKYSQHPRAAQALLETGRRVLGEASADVVFGTGIPLVDKKTCDTTAWTGRNIMGTILTEIRHELSLES